jgi:predicted phosphodiesterase
MRTFHLLLFFVVATRISAQEVTRFMAVSDMHHYSPSPDFSQSMLYELTLAAIDEQVDFIFFTGDMVIRGFESPSEEDSVLKDWRFVLDTLHHHNIKVFACRGNGDASREAWDSLFSGIYSFPLNGPENEKNLTYTIEYDNLLFIILDEYTESHRVNQAWLDETLSVADKEFIFAAGHEPAFMLNMPDLSTCPEERNLFWESLIKAGVKAYFCGHDHFYDHSIINDGDSNPINDVHQVIAGTGGKTLFSDAGYNGNTGRWTPERLYHEEANGYVLVEIHDSEAQMIWKHRIGPGIFEYGGDSCTFLKSPTYIENTIQLNSTIQNHPNPFHTKTTINYWLPAGGEVYLGVYNLLGQKIVTLVDERQPAGSHKTEWIATDLPKGIYPLKFIFGRQCQITRMMILN